MDNTITHKLTFIGDMLRPHSVELTEEMDELLPANDNMEKEVFAEVTTVNFLSLLDYTDQIIVMARMLGFQSSDAAQIIGCSESYVSQRLGVVQLYAKVILGVNL